jgi:hypothetical protein
VRLVQTVERESIESKLPPTPVHAFVVLDPLLLVVVAGRVLRLRTEEVEVVQQEAAPMLPGHLQNLGGFFSQSAGPVFLEVFEHHAVGDELLDEEGVLVFADGAERGGGEGGEVLGGGEVGSGVGEEAGGGGLGEGGGGLAQEHVLLVLLEAFLGEAVLEQVVHEEDGLDADLLLPLQVVLGVAVGVGQVLAQPLVELQQLALVDHPVLLHEHHHPFGGVDQRQALLVHPHDVGHEGLLRGLDEVCGQVGDVHVAPLEGQDHAHKGLDDEGGQVLVVGGEDDLFFLEDGGEDGAEGGRGEGQVEDVAYLVEGVAAEAVEVQHFAVGGLLDEDGFPAAVLVAAGDVVVEGELGRRRHPLGLGGLPHSDVLPLALALVLQQVEVDLVESLVDRVRNDGFRLLQLAVHLQQVHLDLVVGQFAQQH